MKKYYLPAPHTWWWWWCRSACSFATARDTKTMRLPVASPTTKPGSTSRWQTVSPLPNLSCAAHFCGSSRYLVAILSARDDQLSRTFVLGATTFFAANLPAPNAPSAPPEGQTNGHKSCNMTRRRAIYTLMSCASCRLSGSSPRAAAQAGR